MCVSQTAKPFHLILGVNLLLNLLPMLFFNLNLIKINLHQTGTRSSHCPVVRPGPALGCNYCWNTVDNHGRILRRKTKYHCPECQTNLCIVPCFQEYHERHVVQTDPIALTTSVMRVFPKTSSM